MPNSGLSGILTTLLERRPFYRTTLDPGALQDLCRELLAEDSETTGLQLAAAVLDQFANLPQEGRAAFFQYLNTELDIDAQLVEKLAQQYAHDPSIDNFKQLSVAAEPRRQDLFRRLNQAPGATAELVRLRADLLNHLRDDPDLGRTDLDLVHLLRSWFNRGFLVLRPITWDTSASVLERIIAYEAVHEISKWDDLRRRLQPADRKCFAFFHPSMPDDPLIFVEVALTRGVPGSIQDVLSEDRAESTAEEADTAVFYSISNCQAGLAGISFGNSLIKQVVRDLSHELPGLKKFVTLSPIPGLSRWLDTKGQLPEDNTQKALKQLAAHYLLDAKKPDGKPIDPVARFHLGNGAQVHQVHAQADLSDKGLGQSHGVMVNYLYDSSRITQNVEQFAKNDEVAAASAVKTLAKQGAKTRLADAAG
ncbi:malonyl-CoA decarboxylase [Shimia sp.]|uniref:malonyl-CoA decarboxylase n=1 Tax=Shimia sp. TaxID=1954381 RepID=UPI0032978AC0